MTGGSFQGSDLGGGSSHDGVLGGCGLKNKRERTAAHTYEVFFRQCEHLPLGPGHTIEGKAGEGNLRGQIGMS